MKAKTNLSARFKPIISAYTLSVNYEHTLSHSRHAAFKHSEKLITAIIGKGLSIGISAEHCTMVRIPYYDPLYIKKCNLLQWELICHG